MAISMGLLFASCQPSKDGKTETSQPQATEENTSMTTKKEVILFFGNSITAGYELDISEAFPALIEKRLDSLGYTYTVINAGLSGETTSGGLNRIDWVLNTVPDLFVLELGANDALRGLDLNETEVNLQAIIDKVKKANPKVRILIAGMQVPPNLGQDYTTRFRELFQNLATKNQAFLIPFLLEGVAGNPDLNLPDGIHPTAQGHKILTENVWSVLQPLLPSRP